MANYTFDHMIKDQTGFIPRAAAGITYEYMLTEKLSIGIDALYNQRGQLTSINFTDEQGIVIGNGEIRHEMDYISTPVKVAYKTSGKLYGLNLVFMFFSLRDTNIASQAIARLKEREMLGIKFNTTA